MTGDAPQPPAASKEPRCGRCGYPVRGLPTFACPECGADLRRAGIVAPGTRARPTRGRRVWNWTLLFLVAAVPLGMLGDNLMRWNRMTLTRTMVPPGGKYEARLTVTREGYPGLLGRTERQLVIAPTGGRLVTVALPARSLAYTVSGAGAAASGAALDEKVIESAIAASGAPVSPTTKLEALDLLAMIKSAGDAADNDPFPRPPIFFEQRGSRYTGSGGGSDGGLLAGMLLTLWALGAFWVWRRH